MSGLNPFTQQAPTVSIAATTSSANTAIAPGLYSKQVIVSNSGTGTCFVAFGPNNTVTATAASLPVLGGRQLVVSIDPGTTHVACLTASGTATVYFTPGVGE